MSLTLSIAVFFIIWWAFLFASLPFGLRTQDEEGDVVPGTPESAPAKPRLLRVFAINTVVASIVFAFVYFGIENGWITPDTFDFNQSLPAR